MDRPPNCPDPTCTPIWDFLDDEGEGICVGLLAAPRNHDGVLDPYSRCEDGEQGKFNAYDFFKEAEAAVAVLKYAAAHPGINNPCADFGVSDPLAHLRGMLG